MSEDEKLLRTLYYPPKTLFTSVNSLYNALKRKGITLKDVKEFIQKQESTQLFKRPKRIHSYCIVYIKSRIKLSNSIIYNDFTFC